ncbi:ribosomal maturation YjgA family protein [Catenuloplanes japonicus]|uniref:ribosomal maturation YjgA family protein n=1 Tax=Catenuloplanes japonicus TaxID=33876 RepID=UPI00068B3EE6|nr:DUF2809 domain-containing protein [Catenuloplanes japonicus]
MLVRSIAVLTAVLALIVALSIRFFADGAIEQFSGTALYASMVYAAVVFLWPRLSPWMSGAIAVGFCWVVEFSQLTGVPAYLSERSLLARLALGVQFDLVDVFWYPAGVAPLVVVHALLISMNSRRREASRGY